MNEEQLQAIEARANAATTPDDLTLDMVTEFFQNLPLDDWPPLLDAKVQEYRYGIKKHNEYCEALRAAVPALVAEVRRLQALVDAERVGRAAEVDEFNAGYQAQRNGVPIENEPSGARFDVWSHGWIVAKYTQKAGAE